MEGRKKCFNILSVVILILVYCNILTSQITGVKFFLEKQSEKAAIDVYLVIAEGSAKSLRERESNLVLKLVWWYPKSLHRK